MVWSKDTTWQYGRDRIAALLHGGARTAHDLAIGATEDPGEVLADKVDLERALKACELTDKQRAFLLLISSGDWSARRAARVLGLGHDTWRRLVDDRGLISELQQLMDGVSEAP